jgi:hypothetical protein
MGRKSSEKPLYTCPMTQTTNASFISVAEARGFRTQFDKKNVELKHIRGI